VFRHLYRIEETLEKAVSAKPLPRELRSPGAGYLACVNAAGDMASSLCVGYWLEASHAVWAIGIAALIVGDNRRARDGRDVDVAKARP